MKNLTGQKVKGHNHSAIGFVVSLNPTYNEIEGFQWKVAWDVPSFK